MRRYLYTLIIALLICGSYHQMAYSVCPQPVGNTVTCTDNQPNPDLNGVQWDGALGNLIINMLSGSAIDTRLASGGNGEEGIATGDGNITITLNNAMLYGQLQAIETEIGDDVVNITDSIVSHIEANTIELGQGSNTLNITRSVVTNPDGRVLSMTGAGVDNVSIIDSQIMSLDTQGRALNTGSSSDNVLVENSIMQGGSAFDPIPNVVDVGPGDDTVTLSTGADIRGVTPQGTGPGLIDCGSDFDTLVFAMAVPQDQIVAIAAEIASKNPAADDITIDGLTYVWEDCEELVSQLIVNEPIPTLSQWGLIAMVAILGLVGFMVIRRRQVTA